MRRQSLGLAVLLSLLAVPVLAQTSTPPGPGAAGSARPARGPEQNSLGSPAPPAGTTTTTANPNPSAPVQQMNEEARHKVEREGK